MDRSELLSQVSEARADFEAEILLGYTMHLLHQRPVLDRAAIRRALTRPDRREPDAPCVPGAGRFRPRDQVEQIKSHCPCRAATRCRSCGRRSSRNTGPHPSTSGRPHRGQAPDRLAVAGPHPRQADRDQPDRGVAVSPDVLSPLPTLFEAKPKETARGPARRSGDDRGDGLAGAGHEVRLMHRIFAAPLKILRRRCHRRRQEGDIHACPDNAAARTSSPPASFRRRSISLPPRTGRRKDQRHPAYLAPIPSWHLNVAFRGAVVEVTLARAPGAPRAAGDPHARRGGGGCRAAYVEHRPAPVQVPAQPAGQHLSGSPAGGRHRLDPDRPEKSAARFDPTRRSPCHEDAARHRQPCLGHRNAELG